MGRHLPQRPPSGAMTAPSPGITATTKRVFSCVYPPMFILCIQLYFHIIHDIPLQSNSQNDRNINGCFVTSDNAPPKTGKPPFSDFPVFYVEILPGNFMSKPAKNIFRNGVHYFIKSCLHIGRLPVTCCELADFPAHSTELCVGQCHPVHKPRCITAQ